VKVNECVSTCVGLKINCAHQKTHEQSQRIEKDR
jgi:hypothetical protein